MAELGCDVQSNWRVASVSQADHRSQCKEKRLVEHQWCETGCSEVLTNIDSHACHIGRKLGSSFSSLVMVNGAGLKISIPSISWLTRVPRDAAVSSILADAMNIVVLLAIGVSKMVESTRFWYAKRRLAKIQEKVRRSSGPDWRCTGA